MRFLMRHIAPLMALVVLLSSCDRTPRGVMSVNDMADLIVDMQLAEAYIDRHTDEFDNDSTKMVMKQSIFKKHGITQQDYDSSLVWYAHNMEDYTKAYDKAVGKLKARYDKLEKSAGDDASENPVLAQNRQDNPNLGKGPRGLKHIGKAGSSIESDTADLWQGQRAYMLTQGVRRGFITFDIPPDANKRPGDRYQLAYKLTRGGNDFKVSLNVDYTDGATSQLSRSTNSDGWVVIDVQSDTTRRVKRVYGYLSYDIKRGQTGYVDSLMLLRTHLSKSNYGFIHSQRLLERK